jgi:hypothetical protein
MLLLLLQAAASAPLDAALDHLEVLGAAPQPAAARVLPWVGGDRVRIAPEVRGLPVLGGEVTVALDAGERPVGVYGPLPRWPDPGPPAPALNEAQALAGAQALVGGRTLAWAPRASLAWRIEGDELALSWVVELGLAAPFATWRLLIDADSGALLAAVPTSRSALADIYPTNPLRSEVETVELAGLDGGGELSGARAQIWSCSSESLGETVISPSLCEARVRYAAADDGGDFLYLPDPAALADPFAEVQLYHHLDLISGWVAERWGAPVPTPISSYANFEMTNAFYGDFDGDGVGDVSFGQSGDGVDFAYDADVIYHEFGHAIVDAVSDLGFLAADEYGMDWTPGGLNEGSADVFAMLLTGDGQMAEYAGSFDGRTEPIRDLDPDQRCPEDIRGEVHADGEIWGAMFWNIQQRLGAEITAELLWGAITTWAGDVGWPEAGASVLESARALGEAGLLDDTGLAAIEEEVTAANLVGCVERVIALDGGEPVSQYLINAGLDGDYALIPLSVQFSLRVPARGGDVRFRVEGLESSEPDLAWTLFARRGAPVGHEVMDFSSVGLSFAVPTAYDLELEGEGAATLTLGPDTEPAVGGDETWYFALAGRNLGAIQPLDFVTGVITVSGEVVPYVALKPEPRMSCAAAPGRSGAPRAPLGVWVLGAALALRRRR